MTDRVPLDSLTECYCSGEHLRFDILVPSAFVGSNEEILFDQCRNFRSGNQYRNYSVIAKNGWFAFKGFLKGQQFKSVPVQVGIIHAGNFITLATVLAFRCGHEDAFLDLDIFVMEEMAEEAFLLAGGLVGFIQNADIENQPDPLGCFSGGRTALVGGEDYSGTVSFFSNPFCNLDWIGMHTNAQVLSQ